MLILKRVLQSLRGLWTLHGRHNRCRNFIRHIRLKMKKQKRGMAFERCGDRISNNDGGSASLGREREQARKTERDRGRERKKVTKREGGKERERERERERQVSERKASSTPHMTSNRETPDGDRDTWYAIKHQHQKKTVKKREMLRPTTGTIAPLASMCKSKIAVTWGSQA